MVNSDTGFSQASFNPLTLMELLQRRAQDQPDLPLYTFLTDGETNEVVFTCAQLDRHARAIAALLQSRAAAGERALLLYPPGLDYIASFFGCLYAGIVAVPAYPPDPTRLNRTLPRLQAMVADADAAVILTTTPILSLAGMMFDQAPDLAARQWIATDTLSGGEEHGWHEPVLTPESLAFLQYTSGSTRTPRGVMLSHHNLLYNLGLIAQVFEFNPEDRVVIWLPPYHDMGLIGGIMEPLYYGVPCILMSPLAFLQRPLRWLQAISRYKGTVSGGPNFAYDLCIRKVTDEQRTRLDLSSWSVAFNGAEPVRPETLDRFAAAFASCGFRREAFYPCYGLAEATLIASGGLRAAPPIVHTIQGTALKKDRVVSTSSQDTDAQVLVGNGKNLEGQKILIVDPQTGVPCPPDRIGEIWISGPSVAQGYWGRAEETESTFQAFLSDTGEGPFLRTGDLGYLGAGELFVTGRIKDLIIIRGRNHYPQDIELTAEQSHAALRPGCGAAFSVDVAGEERLVVVQEVYTDRATRGPSGPGQGSAESYRPWDWDEVAGTVRDAVAQAHEVQAYAVVLIEPRSIPKTSSGKIQRHACRALYLDGSLETVAASILEEAPTQTGSPQLVGAKPESLLLKALRAMSQQERHNLLTSHLLELAARALRLAPSQLDADQPLNALGLDSIMSIDLMTEIESDLNVTLDVADLVRGVTIAQLAARILAELDPSQRSNVPTFQRSNVPTIWHPLSHGQRALWFLQRVDPNSAAYSLVHAARIPTELDVNALRGAYQHLVDRHPVLRTTFSAPDGEPVQRVHEHVEVFFRHEDASAWSEAQLKNRLAEEVYHPFDLEQGPLLRVFVITRAPKDHIMLLAVHHIVTDLWSLAVLLHELGAFYTAEKNGTTAVFKPLPASYNDYVQWHAEMLAGADGERLWAYWREQLAGGLPELNLPTDRPRPPVQTYHGAARVLRLGEELTGKLRALAHAHGTTLFTTLLAAFQILLYRYTGQEDILVGTPRASRSRKLARLMGYFVNPVVLRANLSGAPTFAAVLESMHQTVLGAFEHGEYPLSLLVERLHPVRDLSRSPIFQVMFAWQKTTRLLDNTNMTSFALGEGGQRMQLGDLTLESFELEQRVTPFDLTLLMAEAGEELAASLEYNSDLFDVSTAARMLEHFRALLEEIARDPNRPIAALPLLSARERELLLSEWSYSPSNVPVPAPDRQARATFQRSNVNDAPRDGQSIPELIEAQVVRTPGAIALQLGAKKLTYAELNERANQLARFVRRMGVGPEVIAGLFVERSIEAIVGMLGILKAGGAFLTLDPANPRERLAFMIEDARVPLLLSQESLKKKWTDAPDSPGSLGPPAAGNARVVCLDSDWQLIAQESRENLEQRPLSTSSAYVIYTSGSTGRPKGVVVPHGTIAAHCRGMQAHFQLDASDRVLQFSSFSFDQALEQILTTLITGATLVLRGVDVWPTLDFTRVVADLGLSVVNIPPAYWHQWVQDWRKTLEASTEFSRARSNVATFERSNALRLVIIGGDVMLAESMSLWQETSMAGARLLNAYGPTETTITALTYDVPRDSASSKIPIGRPTPERRIYILDSSGYLTPPGVPGELYIGGSTVARGYLHRPELTAERFVPDSFSQEHGARLYRTGDLVRYTAGGIVEFLGRVDSQIKIRGFRIELGEIEAALNRHPAVREAAVLVKTFKRSNVQTLERSLVAYLVSTQDPPPSTGELRDFLRESLPDYMLPAAFMFLDALPLTSSGKIDRQALAAAAVPDPMAFVGEDGYVAPRSPVERELADMWATVLGVERVGIHENFFDLGGHSLLATRIIARVRDAFGLDLALRELFETPTVAGLATAITYRLAEEEPEEALEELLAELDALSGDEVQSLLADSSGELNAAPGGGELARES